MQKDSYSSSDRFLDLYREPTKRLSPLHGYELKQLVSLEESVKTLEPIIDNVQGYVWTATGNCDNPKDGLTQDESAAIHLYTMNCLYYQLNDALRNENREQLVPYFSYFKLILTALWKLPDVNRIVWRGVKGNMTDDYPTGKKLVWWGFSSCTTSLEVLQSSNFLGETGSRTLFNIQCFNGKMIQNHSCFPTENEVLLLPCSSFEVIGHLKQGDDLRIIQLLQTQPPVEILRPPFELSGVPKSDPPIAEDAVNKFVKQKIGETIIKTKALNFDTLKMNPKFAVTVKTDDSAMAASEDYLLCCPTRKLCLIDKNGAEKFIIKRYGMVADLCWSPYLNQFLVLNYLGKLIYSLDINSGTTTDLLTLKKTGRAYGCTCYEGTLYVISDVCDEPLIDQYRLSDWNLERSFKPPKSGKDQHISIFRFSNNGAHIGTLLCEKTHLDRQYWFELRRADNMHILQAVRLGTDDCRFICLPNEEFLVNTRYTSKFFLIGSNGYLKQTILFDAKFIWSTALVNNGLLVVQTDAHELRFYDVVSK